MIITPSSFVAALANIRLDHVFNPYSDRCPIYDRADAAEARRGNLRAYLGAVAQLGVDTIWMGRDLGHRGGRRTGLALTDEEHLAELPCVYPGAKPARATKGPIVAERTAAEIWAILRTIRRPPLLWNVFPFHPHEPDNELSNRKFTATELEAVDKLNRSLISWLNVRRIVAIGQDAAFYAQQFGIEVFTVRHPSYGGVREFREGIRAMYPQTSRPPRQAVLV